MSCLHSKVIEFPFYKMMSLKNQKQSKICFAFPDNLVIFGVAGFYNRSFTALEHFWLWDWLNLFMAACLRVPKVTELHSALRRELVWSVVYVPRHPTVVYGTKLAWEIESSVIPTKVYGRGGVWSVWTCVSVNVCVLKETVNVIKRR